MAATSKVPILDLHFRRGETMPLPTRRFQPIAAKFTATYTSAKPTKPIRSGLKDLFDRRNHRQFPTLLSTSSAQSLAEPSSVCLDRMVRSFIEQSHENPTRRTHRRYTYIHGHDTDDDDDDFSTDDCASASATDAIKGLASCASDRERDLLAAVWDVLERTSEIPNGRGDCRRMMVAEWLREIGYDAAVCRSRWEKRPSVPAGEHGYLDVVVGGERVVVDTDFRSEFEIAWPTKRYRALLQALPMVFVGKEERLQRLVVVVCEEARRSLMKGGLHVPPWRRPEYVRGKWLAPYERVGGGEELGGEVLETSSAPEAPWEPPPVRTKAEHRRGKVVSGLASEFRKWV